MQVKYSERVSNFKVPKEKSHQIPNLREFDFNLIRPDYTVAFFGKRRTGKTFMLRYILSMMAHYYPFALCFTNTKINGFWQNYMPSRFIHEGFNSAVVRKFLEWQKLRKFDPNYQNANIQSLIIEDDVISDPKLRYSKEQNALFSEGRHFKTGVFITSQDAKGINPMLRENADAVFFFYMHGKREKESLYDDYLSFLEKDVFNALWEKYTANNMCLVFITDPQSEAFTGNPVDCLFWAKAKDPGEFVLGCEEYWRGSGSMQ